MPGELGHAVAGQLQPGQVRAQPHVDGQMAQLLEAGEPPARGVLRQGNDDLVDGGGAGESQQVIQRAPHRAILDQRRDAAAPVVEHAHDQHAGIMLADLADELGRLRPGPDQDQPGGEPAGALAAADRERGRDVRGQRAGPAPGPTRP